MKKHWEWLQYLILLSLLIGNYYYMWASLVFYIYMTIYFYFKARQDKGFIPINIIYWATAILFILWENNIYFKRLTFMPSFFIMFLSYTAIHSAIKVAEEHFELENKNKLTT